MVTHYHLRRRHRIRVTLMSLLLPPTNHREKVGFSELDHCYRYVGKMCVWCLIFCFKLVGCGWISGSADTLFKVLGQATKKAGGVAGSLWQHCNILSVYCNKTSLVLLVDIKKNEFWIFFLCSENKPTSNRCSNSKINARNKGICRRRSREDVWAILWCISRWKASEIFCMLYINFIRSCYWNTLSIHNKGHFL